MNPPRVPTAPLVPVVEEYLAATGIDRHNLEQFAGLAEGTIAKWLSGEYTHVDFSSADRLLCKMCVVHLWWEEPLREHYYAADLTLVQCAAPGCSVWFKPKTGGQRAHIYCSKSCKYAAVKMRSGVTKRRFKNKGKNKCWRGHELTEENTKVHTDGSRQCRTCFNAAQRKRRARQRACPNGHPATPENTRVNKRGSVICRICRNEQVARHRAKAKVAA